MENFFIRAERAGLSHEEAVALLAEPQIKVTGRDVADPFDTGEDAGPLPF